MQVKKNGDEEITRSNQVIAGPVTTAENGEATTGEETTGGETTAAATAAAAKASSSLNVPSVTTPDFNNTTSASGNSAASSMGSLGAAVLGALANADRDFGCFCKQYGLRLRCRAGHFYSLMDSWQRDANFISQYDKYAAIFGNMRYLTTTVDFYYDGLDWRIQLWKGQYGPFGGGEVGVYTKDPETNDKLYNCADNDHLLNMYYDLYMTLIHMP